MILEGNQVLDVIVVVIIAGLVLWIGMLHFTIIAYRGQCDDLIDIGNKFHEQQQRSLGALRVMMRNSVKLARTIDDHALPAPLLEEIPAAFLPADDEEEERKFQHIVDQLLGKGETS